MNSIINVDKQYKLLLFFLFLLQIHSLHIPLFIVRLWCYIVIVIKRFFQYGNLETQHIFFIRIYNMSKDEKSKRRCLLSLFRDRNIHLIFMCVSMGRECDPSHSIFHYTVFFLCVHHLLLINVLFMWEIVVVPVIFLASCESQRQLDVIVV